MPTRPCPWRDCRAGAVEIRCGGTLARAQPGRSYSDTDRRPGEHGAGGPRAPGAEGEDDRPYTAEQRGGAAKSCVHLHRSCELGYWLRLDATGRGLMSEAAKACVDFALNRLGVHRIRCAAATDNYPSLRVIARLEFRFEGISRQAEYVGGRWVDHAVFGRLSTD